MNREDLDVAALAQYLHLNPNQVVKLVERGQLPGRRVGGQWRFSPEEVNHWLEERLSGGDEEEIAHVERVLEQARNEPELTLAERLPLEAIRLQLDARTRNSVITSMAELAAETGLLWDIGKMADAIRARENLHSTALENGVAFLHPRRPLPHILGESFVALGRTGAGIPFGSERLTDLFFLICSLDDATHLQMLARLSRLVKDEAFLTGLRAVAAPQEAHDLLRAVEQRVFKA